MRCFKQMATTFDVSQKMTIKKNCTERKWFFLFGSTQVESWNLIGQRDQVTWATRGFRHFSELYEETNTPGVLDQLYCTWFGCDIPTGRVQICKGLTVPLSPPYHPPHASPPNTTQGGKGRVPNEIQWHQGLGLGGGAESSGEGDGEVRIRAQVPLGHSCGTIEHPVSRPSSIYPGNQPASQSVHLLMIIDVRTKVLNPKLWTERNTNLNTVTESLAPLILTLYFLTSSVL